MWHFTMTNTSRLKKTLAKEILLFFGILLLTGLFWIFLLLRNDYYFNKFNSEQEELDSITSQINHLPPDKLKVLYEEISIDFIKKYVVTNDKFIVPKKEDEEFLTIYPTAKLLPISPKGYSYTHLELFEKNGKNETHSKPPLPRGYLLLDSTLIFDFVDLQDFRKLLRNTEYKDKLYNQFSQKNDLGTKMSFDSEIEIGLKFNDTAIEEQHRLFNKKKKTLEQHNSTIDKIKSKSEMLSLISWILIIQGAVFYPLRLLYILLKWSIKTVRQNAT